MADKKKKTVIASKAKQSSKNQQIGTHSTTELRKLSVDELQKLLHTARKDLLEAQKSLKANELANPRVVRKMRREIARIMTIIREIEVSEKAQNNSSEKLELKTGTKKPTKEVS